MNPPWTSKDVVQSHRSSIPAIGATGAESWVITDVSSFGCTPPWTGVAVAMATAGGGVVAFGFV